MSPRQGDKLGPPGRSKLALGIAALGFVLLASPESEAKKTRRERPFLLGGPVPEVKTTVRLDPLLPKGAPRLVAFRPAPELRRCSISRPVCVASNKTLDLSRALSLLEIAFEKATFGVGLPRGASDASGTLLWEIADDDFRVELVDRPRLGFDRARSVCVGGELTLDTAARCVLESSLASLAPATKPEHRAGLAKLGSAELLGPSPSFREEVTLARNSPEEGALTSASSNALTGKSALFFEFIAEEANQPDALAFGTQLTTITATKTPPGALRYESEPDVLDALRASLDDDRPQIARFFDRMARAFYFLGTDEFFPEFGGRLRSRLAWDVKSGSFPRNLVLPRAFEPSGSTYLRIEVEKNLENATLAVRASCEAPIRTVWSLLLEGEDEKLERTLEIPFQENASSYTQRVHLEPGVKSVTLVGTNLDWIDLLHPFDPDHGPHEAHACTVYLLKLEDTDPNGASKAQPR